MQNQYKYSTQTLLMVEERLTLMLYAMDNQPESTIHHQAHRTTARRLAAELLADVQVELTNRVD